MIYRNEQQHEVNFKLADLSFSVPPGGECDIPPNLAFAIERRGLPLVAGSAGGERVEAQVVVPIVPRPVPGVGAGGPDDQPALDVEEEPAAVALAVERLREQGVTLKGKKSGR